MPSVAAPVSTPGSSRTNNPILTNTPPSNTTTPTQPAGSTTTSSDGYQRTSSTNNFTLNAWTPASSTVLPSYTIKSAADLETLKKKGITEITGKLVIEGADITDLKGLDKLRKVGELEIKKCNNLTSLEGLSGLKTVKGKLTIQENPALKSLDGLCNLQEVGTLTVGAQQQAIVEKVDGEPVLKGLEPAVGNDALERAVLPKLTKAKDLSFKGNNALTSIGVNKQLTTLTGELFVGYNPKLTSLSGVDHLSRVEGAMTIGGTYSQWQRNQGPGIPPVFLFRAPQHSNNALTSVSFPNLSYAGSISVQDNPAITHCSFPALSRMAKTDPNSDLDGYKDDDERLREPARRGDLRIAENRALTGLSIPQLKEVPGTMQVWSNHSLETIETGIQRVVGRKVENHFYGLSVFACDKLKDLKGFSQLTNTSNLELEFLPSLTNLNDLQNLSSADSMTLTATEVTSTSPLKNLTQCNDALIANNPDLEDLHGFSKLRQINRSLHLQNNPRLKNMDGLANVEAIGDFKLLVSRAHTLNLPKLRKLAALEVGTNGELERISAPMLEQVTGDFAVSGNPKLQAFEFPCLRLVDGSLELSQTKLTDLRGLGALERVGADLQMKDNWALADAGQSLIDQLKSRKGVGGTIGDTSSMVVHEGDFVVDSLEAYRKLKGITKITGKLTLTCPDLTDLKDLRALAAADSVEIRGCHGLTNLEGMDGVIVRGALVIAGNNSLKVLANTGFSLAGQVCIEDNPALESASGLFGVGRIKGDLVIRNNPSLVSIGTPLDGPSRTDKLERCKLSRVDGNFIVTNNPRLTDEHARLTAADIATRAKYDRNGGIMGQVIINGNG